VKEIEKEVRNEVQQAVEISTNDAEAGYDEMFSDIYKDYKWDNKTRTVERENYYVH